VASFVDKQRAINLSQSLASKGYNTRIILNDVGRYAVSLGLYSLDAAREKKREAIDKGDVPQDTYVMGQERVVKVIPLRE
jgi:hypothetical protein